MKNNAKTDAVCQPSWRERAINSSLLSGTAVYLLSNVLTAAIPFALLPILTRYLTPAEYGVVAIFQALLAALAGFISLNSQGAAGVKYFDANLSRQELKYFIGNCFLVLGVISAVILSCAYLFRQALVELIGIEIRWILLSILVSVAAFVVYMRLGQWQVRKQSRQFGTFQVSQSLLNMLLSLLFVVYFLQGAAGRIWALALVPVVYAAIALFLLHKDELLGFAWRPGYLREILSFGVPLLPHSAGLFLLSFVDRFFIGAELGLAQVGIYMVAVQIVAALGLVFDAINNAYTPWLYERLQRNLIDEKRQIVRGTYGYCLVLLGVVVLVFAMGSPVIILLAGEQYRAATEVIGWLALGQAFQGMYLMVTNYVFYSKRTALLSLSTITSGLINVVLLMLLISLMGLKGAAIAYAISMACKFLLTWRVAQLRHPMPWFDFRYSG